MNTTLIFHLDLRLQLDLSTNQVVNKTVHENVLSTGFIILIKVKSQGIMNSKIVEENLGRTLWNLEVKLI